MPAKNCLAGNVIDEIQLDYRQLSPVHETPEFPAGHGLVMNEFLSKSAVVFLASAISACATSYDFRSDDRPEYENTITTTELTSMQSKGATILDVRLIEDFDADPVLVPNATYRDPDNIQQWVGQMSPADGPVIVYCVRGKWVSQKAANYLRDEGFEVYSLEGGIEGWKSAGQYTTPVAE